MHSGYCALLNACVSIGKLLYKRHGVFSVFTSCTRLFPSMKEPLKNYSSHFLLLIRKTLT